MTAGLWSRRHCCMLAADVVRNVAFKCACTCMFFSVSASVYGKTFGLVCR